jgi:hypothetical protein
MAFANKYKGMSLTKTTSCQHANADYQAIHLCIFIYFFRLSTRGLRNCADLPKLLKNFVSNHTSYVSGYPEHNLNFYNYFKLFKIEFRAVLARCMLITTIKNFKNCHHKKTKDQRYI